MVADGFHLTLISCLFNGMYLDFGEAAMYRADYICENAR